MSLNLRTAVVVAVLLVAGWLVAPVLLRSQTSGRGAFREYVLGREVVAGDVLVRFRDDAIGRMRQIERDLDADDNQPVGAGEWRRIHSASRSAQALLTALSSRADVLEGEPNYIVHTTATIPDDPLFSQVWGLSNQGHPGADIPSP